MVGGELHKPTRIGSVRPTTVERKTSNNDHDTVGGGSRVAVAVGVEAVTGKEQQQSSKQD